jgi:hypothetical protein
MADEAKPTADDLRLIERLAHEQTMQANGTQDRERLWIGSAAQVIEKLAAGTAEPADYETAEALLKTSH